MRFNKKKYNASKQVLFISYSILYATVSTALSMIKVSRVHYQITLAP